MNETTRPKAADSLREWSTRTGIPLEAAREVAGVARSTLNAWMRGEGSPRVQQAIDIETLTGGLVPIREWGNEARG